MCLQNFKKKIFVLSLVWISMKLDWNKNKHKCSKMYVNEKSELYFNLILIFENVFKI